MIGPRSGACRCYKTSGPNGAAAGIAGLLLCMLLLSTGCGSGSQASGTSQQGLAQAPAPSEINSYFGTGGNTTGHTTAHIWTTKLNRTSNQVNGEDRTQYGNQLAGSIVGTLTEANGFLDLTLTTVPNELTGQTIGFALEIPGRAGLIRYGDIYYPLIPLAPTNSCTSIGGSVPYNYVTFPDSASPASWVPSTDSTYGTFQVAIDGDAWNFTNITQFTLAGGAPTNPGSGLPTGYCGIGAVGHTVTAASNATGPPLATVTMGFGPSGFFLEDNGSSQATPAGVVPSNALGAGAGAIGAIQPSSPLNNGNVVGGQYLGFYYEPGIPGGGAVTQLASFGCSGSSCPMPPSPTAIIGGVFPNTGGTSPVDEPNLPAAQNVTIDLGTQDSKNNGLYPSATITVSGISFPAAAVVGSLEQKYAIFLIAEDTINGVPLAIYLFQQ